jgi:signal transduction histidine kinase
MEYRRNNSNEYLNLVSPLKRGWGLGLSLTKRIVEEYHRGSIKVSHSEIGKAPLCKSA